CQKLYIFPDFIIKHTIYRVSPNSAQSQKDWALLVFNKRLLLIQPFYLYLSQHNTIDHTTY
ncbi:MAG: hypothetical protein PHU66_01735, partial [Bacteroidaceae bacterium]|nr:hypothetical protein [Bacteroidaceae bacterium]